MTFSTELIVVKQLVDNANVTFVLSVIVLGGSQILNHTGGYRRGSVSEVIICKRIDIRNVENSSCKWSDHLHLYFCLLIFYYTYWR